MFKEETILSYLRDNHILDDSAVAGLLEKHAGSGESLISILKADNLVTEDDITKIVAAANKLEFINLSSDMVDPIAAHLLGHELVSQYNVIPIRLEKDKLTVAMSSPLNLAVREQIESKTGYRVIPVAATALAIKQAIMYHFNVRNVTRQDIVSIRMKKPAAVAQEVKSKYEMNKASNAPVTRLVASIINGAIEAKASDIHIEPQEPDIKVRYRIDGILRDAIEVPANVQREVVSHIKILADMDISEKRAPQDGHIALSFNGRNYDLRVSTLPAVGGEKIVIRILDKDSGTWTIDQVFKSRFDNERFREIIANPYGMILITGPTGSGKTTTLYSALQHLNTPERNLITVEDPVEYRLMGATQVQVKPAAGMTFASSLRSILRQDPDVILIGEIRDFETAEMAIRAALTGHLVLSTLHTNDAAGAVSRLVNIGIPPFLVASSLLGTVAQRLVRRICSHCKEPCEATQEDIDMLGSQYKPGMKLYHGAGCGACFKTGYLGRRSIYEILPMTAEMRKLVVSGASDDAIKQTAISEGMKSLSASGIEAVMDGDTTVQELLRVIDMRE